LRIDKEKMKLLIATSNQGKFDGIRSYLEGLQLNILSLKDIEVGDSELVEDQETFAGNAEKKAKFFAKKSKLMTLSDDSGIIVEALKDELGVKTRRWGLGENASDEEWLNYFLKRMEHEDNRKAKFVSYVCLVDSDTNIIAKGEGELYGTLLKELQVPIKPGVPLSSIFVPNGYDKVNSALSVEEKSRISHRGKAVGKIKDFLGDCLKNR
jgi:non-canonical purine NTP pyrophosphatase (RdgB/HAM1 family)